MNEMATPLSPGVHTIDLDGIAQRCVPWPLAVRSASRRNVPS
jgi:hypothetical protein